MSQITDLNITDPNFGWIVGSLPLAIALDLALGDLPGRTQASRGLRWLIEITEGSVQATVERVGGGRGGQLFGGILLTISVVGCTASVVWLVVELGDTIGGPVSLVVRTGVIGAGLILRAAGDRIVHAAETSDPHEARRFFRFMTDQPIASFPLESLPRFCLAATAEWTLSAVVAPLFWLALLGPAAMWGFLAMRVIGRVRTSVDSRDVTTMRFPRLMFDLAVWLPARLAWVLITVSAWIIRANWRGAWRTGWRAGQANRKSAVFWTQGAMAGALDNSVGGQTIFDLSRHGAQSRVSDSPRVPEAATVAMAVRLMQINTLVAAGLVALISAIG